MVHHHVSESLQPVPSPPNVITTSIGATSPPPPVVSSHVPLRACARLFGVLVDVFTVKQRDTDYDSHKENHQNHHHHHHHSNGVHDDDHDISTSTPSPSPSPALLSSLLLSSDILSLIARYTCRQILRIGGRANDDPNSRVTRMVQSWCIDTSHNVYGNRWYHWFDTSVPREGHLAVMINDKLYLGGGRHGSTGTDAAIWDITTQEPHVADVLPWHSNESSYRNAPHFAGLRNAASVVINDQWIVIGGSFPPSNNDPYAHILSSLVHSYSPITSSWSSLPAMSSHRECMAATVLHNKIYVSGGVVTRMEPSGIVATFECFDMTTSCWLSLPDMPSRRHSHSMMALPHSNDIIVLGGEESDGAIHVTPVAFTCYRYNINTRIWQPWINLPAVSGIVHSLWIDEEHMIMLISRYGCWTLPLEINNSSLVTIRHPHTTWIPVNDIVEFGCEAAIVAV